MDIKERLENARYTLVEAEKAVNELHWASAALEGLGPIRSNQICDSSRRVMRAMAKMRDTIDLAVVTLGQDPAK